MGCRPPRILLLMSRFYGTLGAQSAEKGTALLIAGLYFSATRHGGFDGNSETVLKNGLLFVLFIFLVFFTKSLDKSDFFLYNDAVIELSVVQEAFGFCFYILFFADAEQKANEDHGIPLTLPCSVHNDESGERGFS